VAKIYKEFIERWPDAKALSKAEVSAIADVIRPLGLISRAERLRRMAQEVLSLGRIPCSIDKLSSLPGVGKYVASTTLAMAFGLNRLAVDGVSSRVYSRYFGREITELQNDINRVSKAVPKGKAHLLNWAVLDIAGTICLPKIPRCKECPCNTWCSFVE